MKTLEDMTEELEAGIREFEDETGVSGDEVWFDFVVSACHVLLMEEQNSEESVGLAREFCRTQIGSIPQDLEPYLGKKDWIGA